MSALTVHLEIGHEASLRSKITPEGFTHDWEVYVRGANHSDIHHYVDKVVFYLHETFPKPKRVVKEPPYSVKTSGYAGFNLPIEIYLRNSQEPRKIKFNYDLQLQPNGPTIHKVQKEKYVFISPNDEFRSKLLKGGAIVGSGSSHEISEIRSNIDEKNQMTSKPKLSTSSLDILKKQKYRPDTSNSFQNLFGTPITKTNKQEVVKPKEQPQSKNPSSLKPEKEKSKNKSIYKDKEKIKSSNDSKTKEERKNKDKPKDHERNKEKKREKSRDRSVTPKEKERNKEEKKSKKEKREHKENKHRDKEKNDHKEHKSRTSKENHMTKEIKEPSPLPQPKTERKDKLKEILKDEEKQQRTEEKSKHKYKKKDKERKEKKEEKSHKSLQEKKSDKPMSLVKENGKELPPDKSSLFDSPKSEEQQISKKLLTPPNIVQLGDDSSCSSRNSSREPSPIPPPPPPPVPQQQPPPPPPPTTEQQIEMMPVKKTQQDLMLMEQKKIKDEIKEKKKEKREKKRDKKLEKEHEKKRKRKLDADMELPPPEKKERDEDLANNNSDDERKVSSSEDATVVPPQNENEDYMGMLRDLQHKIMGLRDNSDLQKVVQLIAETGRYEVSAHTFDFDLCLLEPSTVRQLQDFFSTIS